MTTVTEDQELMTAEEVADRLRVNLGWVYRAARLGQIPAVRVGRYVRFAKADVDEWIKQGGSVEA